MGLSIPNAAYDAYFAYFAACTRLTLVSDADTPTDLTGELAGTDLVAGDGNGDFTVGAGDPSGRKLTIAAQENVSASASGTTKHAVLSLAGAIRLVTTCAERTLDHTQGDKVNMSSFYLQVSGPSLPA